jgi:hypothetical protein
LGVVICWGKEEFFKLFGLFDDLVKNLDEILCVLVLDDQEGSPDMGL